MEMNSVQSWFLLYGEEVPSKDRAWELFPAAYDAKNEKYMTEIPDDPIKVIDYTEFALASMELLDKSDCPYPDSHPVNIKITNDGIRLAQVVQLSRIVVGLDEALGAGGAFADHCIKSIKENRNQ